MTPAAQKQRRPRRPKIKVTAEHIANQRRASCEECAIALALHDALGGGWHVWFKDARDENGFGDSRIRFTPRVQRLQRALDRGEQVEPFEF